MHAKFHHGGSYGSGVIGGTDDRQTYFIIRIEMTTQYSKPKTIQLMNVTYFFYPYHNSAGKNPSKKSPFKAVS